MLEYWYIKRGLLYLEWGREVEAKPKTFCRKKHKLKNPFKPSCWSSLRAESKIAPDFRPKWQTLTLGRRGGVQDNFGTNSSSECILVLALVYSEK